MGEFVWATSVGMKLMDELRLVEEVRNGIEQGVQPRLNSKGSSGSYFARDASGTTLGIFKPKDEEVRAS